jgi:tetratricopeptide (TPR) repeat protein
MKKGLLFFILVLFYLPAESQTLAKNDELKFEADYAMMDKDFKKALTNYLSVLKSEPDNANIKYKAGICYLNSENEKGKAIPYLEEAAQKVSEKYRADSFKETNAPVDALFLLGSAYRISNRLDDAINAYIRFKNYLSPADEYELRVVEQYLKNCEMAKGMLEHPVRMVATNMGKPVNTEQPNFNAVFSGDGKTLLYTTPGREGYDIFYATMGDTAWTTPKNIASTLGTGKYMVTTDLSEDGQTLLLALDDPVNADIYMSKFSKGRWSKVEPLGKEINSKSNETYASLSPDGKVLYFTSDRKGGLGDLDIYKSELDGKGLWGKPVNLGPGVNTPFNEASPFITESSRKLYFSSEGHDGIGGYDIFYYDFDNPGLGAVNPGYPLNTTDNDLFYVPMGDGSSGYFAYRGIDSYGGRDIYTVQLLPPELVTEETPVAFEEPVTENPEVAVTKDSIATPGELPVPVAEMLTIPVEETAQVPSVEEDMNIDQSALVEQTPPAIKEEVVPVVEETPVTEAAVVPVIEEPVREADLSFTSIENAASYKVQIMALKKPVDLSYFTSINGVSLAFSHDNWYRYSLESTTDKKAAEQLLSEIVRKGYGDAFIRGNSIYPQYTIQVMAVPGPVVDLTRFANLPEIVVTKGADNFCHYTTGEFASKEEAMNNLNRIKSLGYSKAFVTVIKR